MSVFEPAPDKPVLRPVKPRFSTARSIVALILREMSTSYGRSPGGYVWAILEPAGGIALLALLFSIGFRNPPLGTDFAFFYAGGMLPFILFADVSGKLGQTMQQNRALLEYPRVTFVDALVARTILNVLTQLMVLAVVLPVVVVIGSVETVFDFGKMALAYAMVICVAVGVGSVNAYFTLAFPIWSTAWTVITRPLFLASGIIFLLEAVPQPYDAWLSWNPLIHVTGLMRDAMYPYYRPDYIDPGYVFAFGSILTAIGLFLLNRFHRDILDK